MKAISTSRLRDNLLKSLAISAVAVIPGAVFVPAALAAPSPTPQTPPVDCKLGFTDGDGTAAHPFLISNEVALAGINDCLLYHQYFYYKLTKDIVLKPDFPGYTWDTSSNGWTPIGTTAGNYFTGNIRGSAYLNNYDFPFTGVFDGGGHTISNLNVDAQDDSWGLFGLTQNAVIKNLNVVADVQTNGYDNVGAVVGDATYSDNGSDRQSSGEDSFYLGSWDYGNDGYALYIPDNFGTTVTNVNVDATMNASGGTYYTGLAVGGAYGSTINKVTTSGEFSLYGSYDVGGVVGRADNSTLTNLASSATIGNNGGFYTLSNDVGGVVGTLRYDSTLAKASFTGTVTGNYSVGGVVGYTAYSTITDASVSSASKVSPDTSTGDSWATGGVVGDNIQTNINNASFAGTLSANMVDGQDAYDIGGIVGYMDGNGRSSLTNSTVAKSAKITVNGDTGASGVGGIAGHVFGTSLANVVNHANISVIDAQTVGGIVGDLGGYGDTSSIDHALNTGNITVSMVNNSGDYFGGLVGYNEDTLSISNSGNQGDVNVTGVQAPEFVGGIIGDAYTTTVTDSYNTGDVTGWNTVAGIIAYAEDARTTVHGSYDAGAVTAETNGSEESDGIANGEFGDVTANNTVLGGTGIRNRTGANVLTAAQLKSTSVLSDNGWDLGANATWNLDGATNAYNGGFPFLSWEYTPTVAPAPSGSPTADPGTSHTYSAVSFAKNSYKLSTSAKNYLSSVAESIKSAGYTTVTIDGYAKAKVTTKVTSRRNNAVKSYLQSAGVTATITVHQNLVGSHVADTVVVSAAN